MITELLEIKVGDKWVATTRLNTLAAIRDGREIRFSVYVHSHTLQEFIRIGVMYELTATDKQDIIKGAARNG